MHWIRLTGSIGVLLLIGRYHFDRIFGDDVACVEGFVRMHARAHPAPFLRSVYRMPTDVCVYVRACVCVCVQAAGTLPLLHELEVE